MDDYPPRVTLHDDGVYRWSYDMDMWHNGFMLRLILKVLGIICAVLYGFMLAALGFDSITPFGALILLLPMAALFALTLLIYVVCAWVMRGHYRVRYEMDESTIVLVPSSAAKKRNGALASAVALAGFAAGKSGKARRAGAMLRAADVVGTTLFSEISRVKAYPKWDVINLHEWLTMNQIYVCPEDYPFVVDFILAHISEKARGKSGA